VPNSPSLVSGDKRSAFTPGSLGGDPASHMARPMINAAIPGTNQRSSVSAGAATAGTFTLRVQGRGNSLDVMTAAINFNDSLAALVSKINAALNPLGLTATGVSGGPLPAASVVEIGGAETYTVTATNVTGLTGGTMTITTPQAASGAVQRIGPARAPVNTRSSAMARPKAPGRRRF
jgi:hypothetical protein